MMHARVTYDFDMPGGDVPSPHGVWLSPDAMLSEVRNRICTEPEVMCRLMEFLAGQTPSDGRNLVVNVELETRNDVRDITWVRGGGWM